MERSVCSFKSFISIVPPNPKPNNNNKPLPPLPSTSDSPTLDPVCISSTTSISEQASSTTSWQALKDSEWDDPSLSSQSSKTHSILVGHNDSPSLPSLSPRIETMQTHSDELPVERSAGRAPRPESDEATLYEVPEPTPRNPAGQSPFQIPRPRSSHEVTLPSADDKLAGSSVILQPSVYQGPTSNRLPEATRVVSSNFSYRLSGVTTRLKASKSLGNLSPRNTATIQEEFPGNLNFVRAEYEGIANRGKAGEEVFRTTREDSVVGGNLYSSEMTDKVRKLSLGRDQRQLMASHSHELDTRYQKQHAPLSPTASAFKHALSLQTRGSTREHLISQSFGRRRSSDSFSCSSSLVLESQAKMSSEYKRKQDIKATKLKRSGSQRESLRRKDIRLPSILTNTKNFRFSQKRTEIDRAKCNESVPSAVSLPFPPTSPHEQVFSTLRMPGGFATVRRPPFNLPQLQTSNINDAALWTETLRESGIQSPTDGSPVSASTTFFQRPILRSPRSQAPVLPAMVVHRELRHVASSPSPGYFRSCKLQTPTSPLALEIPLPPTPQSMAPTSPHGFHSPLVASPLSIDSVTPFSSREAGNRPEKDTHIHKILGKARVVRDTWRRSQKDVRREKLKQSIRVLGPTDLATAAEYTQ